MISVFLSFRRSLCRTRSGSRARSEALALSSKFNMFWMPDQIRHDDLGFIKRPSTLNIDGLVKSHFFHFFVIPAKAGIQ
jgi:hypothetical protein